MARFRQLIYRLAQITSVALIQFVDYVTRRIYGYYPFGRTPQSTKDIYLGLAEDAKNECYPKIDEFERAMGYAISFDWLHELALHTQIVVKKSRLCYSHGRVLYSLLSRYIERQNLTSNSGCINIIETGTARGFSALCMAKALKDSHTTGTIITFDVLPHDQPIYWNCIDDLEGVKSRRKLLAPWKALHEQYVVFCQGYIRSMLPKVKLERINFAFLDGSHTYSDVMFEYEQIKKYQMSGDVIVFDDYTPKQYPGLVSAVDEICGIGGYEKEVIEAHNMRAYVIATKC